MVEGLDLLDNKITAIGCEQLARLFNPFTPNPVPPIKHLILDHNPIGSAGCNALLKGIHANDFITNLSMTYCRLDKDCSRSIFELLIFSKSKVQKLNLAGNELRNEGFI